jgi:DNA-binding CsgD family transcriptional regulator/tetratricopeptide (TPR) repeat protein
MDDVATRVSSPVFIGRARELEILGEAVVRATEGVASIVLIGGDAGIGKTRLVTETADLARAQGALVLEGGCVELGDSGGLPFAPIVEALRRLLDMTMDDPGGQFGSLDSIRSPATAELGRLLPELGPIGPDDFGGVDRPEWIQARIFEGVLALLRALSTTATVVLILEDLHWADGSTRDLITFLARNVRSERLLVVGTYRTDELTRRHPLRPWLAEMERIPRVQRSTLARFERHELQAQVAAILDSPADATLVDALDRRSEGNPFFVEELLAYQEDGVDRRLPESLRDVLLARVVTLSDDAQELLGVASVAGRTVDPALLADVVDRDASAIEGPLREALGAQLLIDDPSTRAERIRFRHALLREAVYDDRLPSERRRLHAAFAAVLESRPVTPGAVGASQLAAVAHHAAAAHEPVRALRAWVKAAQAAAAASAFAEALSAYEHAIELWDAVPADDRPTDVDAASLHHEACLAAMVSGRPDRAVSLARAAVGLLDPEVDPERWALASERLGRALWVSGSMVEALATLESTAASMERSGPSAVRAQVMAGLAGAYMLLGDQPRARTTAEIAIELARETGATASGAHALNTLGTSIVESGDCETGLPLLRESFAMTRSTSDVHDLGRTYANLSSALLMCGDAEASYALATEGMDWARSVGTWGQYGRFIAGNAVAAAVELGDWDGAELVVNDLLGGEAVGVTWIGTISAAGAFLARRGRTDEAAALLEEGRVLIEPLREQQFTAPIYIGLVELALATGQPKSASSLARIAIDRLRLMPGQYYVIDVLAIAARAEADVAETARARRRPDEADDAARQAAAYADDVRATVGRRAHEGRSTVVHDAAVAMSAAEAERAAGSPGAGAWRTAVAACDLARSAWSRAYSRYRLSEALLAGRGGPARDSGAHRDEAEAALSAAWSIATGLGARPLLDWISSLAKRGRLTLTGDDERSAPGDSDPGSPEAEPTGLGVATPTDPLDGESAPADPFDLTRREREVLALVAEGYTNRRIAEALFISESTAGVHVSNILGKLGVSSRAEAAAVAARLGLDRGPDAS